jgi:hypothetical protein
MRVSRIFRRAFSKKSEFLGKCILSNFSIYIAATQNSFSSSHNMVSTNNNKRAFEGVEDTLHVNPFVLDDPEPVQIQEVQR